MAHSIEVTWNPFRSSGTWAVVQNDCYRGSQTILCPRALHIPPEGQRGCILTHCRNLSFTGRYSHVSCLPPACVCKHRSFVWPFARIKYKFVVWECPGNTRNGRNIDVR